MCDGRNEKVQNPEKSDFAIDDLDRELNDYNAQAAQEIKRAAEEPKNKKQGGVWRPFDEDADDNPELQMQLNTLDRVRSHLTAAIADTKRRYNDIDEEQKKEKKQLIEEWFAAIIFFVLLYVVVGVLFSTVFKVAWYILFGMVVVFTFVIFWKLLKRTLNFRIICTEGESAFIEKNKVSTYRNRREHLYAYLGALQEKLNHLEAIEKRMQRNGTLSEEELNNASRLGFVVEPPYPYQEKKYDVFEYLSLRNGKKKGY